MPGLSNATRHCFGLAAGLGVAAVLSVPLHGQRDDWWVLVVSLLAILLLVLRTRIERLRHGGAIVTVVLVGLAAVGLVPTKAPWVLIFAVAAAIVALVGLVLWRFGRRGGIGLALATVLAAGALAVTAPSLQRGKAHWFPVHDWNQFHYVLGTKYFDELGYFDLYVAVLMADREDGHRLGDITRLRNLHTYKPIDAEDAVQQARDEGLREKFSDERWAGFQRDFATFTTYRDDWRGVLRDLGFNPSPAWLVVHRPLLNAIELRPGITLELLALLQVPMYGVAMAACWWAFGLRNTLWMALWTGLFFGNRNRLLGGYFSYDWYLLTVIPVALLAKARGALAAPLVAYGGLMRGFPGLLAIGPTVTFLDRAVRERRLDRTSTRFVASLALAMLLLIGASCATPRGAGIWLDWKEKISLHSARISVGGRHLGLKTLFGEDYGVPGVEEDMGVRRETFARQSVAYRVAQVLLIAWAVVVIRRRDRVDGAVLGLIPAYAIMVLSRYYYASWVVLLLLGTSERKRETRPVVAVPMFAMLAVYSIAKLSKQTTAQWRYQFANEAFLVFFVAILAAFTWIDLRERRRVVAQPS